MTNHRWNPGISLPLLAVVLVVGGLIYLLGPILSPFVASAIIGYICVPMVDHLERRVPRWLAVCLVLLLLTLITVSLLLVMVPLFQRQLTDLISRVPGYAEWARVHIVPWLQQRLGAEFALDADHLRQIVNDNMESIRGFAQKILPSIGTHGLAVIHFVTNALLVPVVLFYFLRDWHAMLAHLDQMIPRRWHARAVRLAQDTNRVLGEFLRGQLLVMMSMALIYSIVLSFVGLDSALPIGILSGVLVFIPYLGAFVGCLLASGAALLQFPDLWGLVWVLAAFGIGQTLESMIITPYLVGDRIGLHPVVIIFALMAFGQVFGFVGVLLALPASAALLVWLRDLRHHYLQSNLYALDE